MGPGPGLFGDRQIRAKPRTLPFRTRPVPGTVTEASRKPSRTARLCGDSRDHDGHGAWHRTCPKKAGRPGRTPSMGPLERLREWRIDRMTDCVAPAAATAGRRARTYGAADAHFVHLGAGARGARARARRPPASTSAAAAAPFLPQCDRGDRLRRRRRRSQPRDGVPRRAASPFTLKRRALPFGAAEFTAVSSIVAFFFFPAPHAWRCARCNRVLAPNGRIAIYTTSPEAKGTMAAPYPLATRGHFYTDEELQRLPPRGGLLDRPGQPARRERLGPAPLRATLTPRSRVKAVRGDRARAPLHPSGRITISSDAVARIVGETLARVLRAVVGMAGRKWLPDRATRGIENRRQWRAA